MRNIYDFRGGSHKLSFYSSMLSSPYFCMNQLFWIRGPSGRSNFCLSRFFSISLIFYDLAESLFYFWDFYLGRLWLPCWLLLTSSSLLPRYWMMYMRKKLLWALSLLIPWCWMMCEMKRICLNLLLRNLGSLEIRIHHWINWNLPCPWLWLKVFYEKNSNFWLNGVDYGLTPYFSSV